MKFQTTCPHCGAPQDYGGLCPACEFAAALEGPTVLGFEERSESVAIAKRFGEYELLEEVGHGGMGVVYKARHIKLDRIVALKLLLLGQFSSEQAVKRFQREAQASAALRHSGLVSIYDVGEVEGQHYLTMELVEGRSLASLLRDGPLSARVAATYCREIAEAMHAAHTAGIIHRDLKPANVLIDPFDQPRITDFGLAKRFDAISDITLTGQIFGSPNYIAPELAAGREKECGPSTDIFAIGAILYECLTGRPPFMASTLQETLLRIRDSEPVAPHVLTAKLPRDLETISLKCLEKEPSRRYQTAKHLADDLNRFLRDETIEARPATAWEKAWRWRRRNPALAGLGSLLVLMFTIGFAATLWQWRHAVQYARAAEDNRERADQNLYDSDMSLAQHAWDDGDLGRTLSLLEAHRPLAREKDRRSFEWYYFRNLCEGDPHITLRGHSQTVNCVAFSPDGKLLATGSVGDPVRIWDSATGKIVKTLPEQNVLSLAFTPDGQSLGVGGRDRVVVWNLETERAVFKHEEAFERFRIAFASTGTLLVIGKRGGPYFSDGGSAELWDYATGKLKHVFPESGGYVAVSSHGGQLATGNWNKTIKIWELATGQFVRSFNTGEVLAMALSPDGNALATSHWGPEVELWNVATGQQIGSLTNNQHKVWSMAFSPDDRSLATSDANQAICLWDRATLQKIKQFRGHANEVMSVTFAADGQTLASGSKDKAAMLWSVHPKLGVTTVSNIISRPIFSSDGQFVAAGIGQNKVVAWDVATLQVKAAFDDASEAVAFSSDGRSVTVRGSNYFLRTFDVATRAVRETIPGRRSEENDLYVVLSPNGQILVTSLTDGSLMFSDAKTGAVRTIAPHAYEKYIFQLAFSSNGKLLAMACGQPETEWGVPVAKIWDTATYKMVAAPAGHTDSVLSVGFSPDSRTLATSSADNTVKFWDTTTWREISPSLGQKEYVTSLAYSPNGRTLATACADRTIKLWNAATRRELISLKIDAHPLRIAFSPDGQTLAVHYWNGSLRLWRAPVLPDKKQ